MIKPREKFVLERNTLRLLCAARLEVVKRDALCQMLRPEVFLDPIHRILFEEICALHTADGHHLHELLAARVTNRGFPDADLEPFLSAEPVPDETFDDWIRSVKTLAADLG